MVKAEPQKEHQWLHTLVGEMTLGYDPQKKRFVGTWIGSIMSYL